MPKPQIYTWTPGSPAEASDTPNEPSQYAGDMARLRRSPQVEGTPSASHWVLMNPEVAVANQGDWVSITKHPDGFGLAVRSDGTLWAWGSSPISVAAQLMAGIQGFSTEMVQVGHDTDWTKCNGQLLLKADGSMWSIGSNVGGKLGLGVSPGPGYMPWTGEFSSSVYAKLSTSVASVTPVGVATFSSKPATWIEASNGDPESGSGAAIEAQWSAAVTAISVTSTGSGYTTVPKVSIWPSDVADANSFSSATVTSMTLSKTREIVVVNGGAGYTTATATDSVTGATATAVISGGVIVGWTMTSEGVAASNPLITSHVTITGDGVEATARSIPYPSGVTGITVDGYPEVWTSVPTVTISGLEGPGSVATAVVSGFSGTVKGFTVTDGGSGYTTASEADGCRSRILCAVAVDGNGYKQQIGVVNLTPAPVSSVVFNLPFSLPAGSGVSVYFNREGSTPALAWYLFGTGGSLTQAGNGYATEPPAYLVYNGVAEPNMVLSGPWSDIDGFEMNAIDASSNLWWWYRSGLTYPTRVGQGLAADISPSHTSSSSTITQTMPSPDSPSGVLAIASATGVLVASSSDEISQVFSYTYGLFQTVYSPGIGYTSTPADSAPFTFRLVGPSTFTNVERGYARDSAGRWWKVSQLPLGGSSPMLVVGTKTVDTPDAYHSTMTSSLSLVAGESRRVAYVENPGSGYADGDKLRVVLKRKTVQQNTSYSGTTAITYYSVVETQVTDDVNVSWWQLEGTSFPPFVYYGDVISASIISATGSGATVQVMDFPVAEDTQPMQWATIPSGTSTQSAPPPSYFRTIDSGGNPIYGGGYRSTRLPAGAVAYDGTWALLGNGQIDDASGGSQVALWGTWTGGGYTDPVQVSIGQPAGVASATTTIDGKLISLGVLASGGSYPTPPTVTIDGTATAEAVIEGQVVLVSVTSAGSGYRQPPIVRFSQPGLSASAAATLDGAGGVASVSISSGGTYRVAPTVTFEPVPDLDSITVTNQGGSYTSAPEVRIVAGSGGGSGGTAYAVLNGSGGVGSIVITSRGSGYYDTPKVLLIGGGGDAATAVASVAAPGAGATATATISGRVIFARVTNQGSGYQTAPAVTVSGSKGAVLQARIAGPINSTTISAGSGYSPGATLYPVASVEHRSYLPSDGGYTSASVSGGGSIASVTTEGTKFFNSPSIVFNDAYYARADTVLTRQAVSVYGETEATGPISVDHTYGINTGNVHLSVIGPIGGFSQVGYYGYGLTFSTPPTITVEDVAGSGCTLSATWASGGRLSALGVTAAGSGYTLNARLAVRGGRRYVWDHAATATAVVDANGHLVAVNVTSSGGGYNAVPEVIISGGGGTGAVAKVRSFTYQADGLGIATIAVTDPGSGYAYTPTVTIIDRNDISGTNDPSYLTSNSSVYLSSAMPEYAWQDVPQQRSLSQVEYLPVGVSDWMFIPHYVDGWIEHLYLDDRTQRFSATRPRKHTASPAVTITGPGGSAATGQASLVQWSSVFCDGAAKRTS